MRKSMLLYVQCTVPYFPSGHTFASAACGFILSQWESRFDSCRLNHRAAVKGQPCTMCGP